MSPTSQALIKQLEAAFPFAQFACKCVHSDWSTAPGTDLIQIGRVHSIAVDDHGPGELPHVSLFDDREEGGQIAFWFIKTKDSYADIVNAVRPLIGTGVPC